MSLTVNPRKIVFGPHSDSWVQMIFSGLIPLFENMISGSALHPGDVVLSMDDRTIVVEDTDNEGRVAMADALVYSSRFNPSVVMSIATLTREFKLSKAFIPPYPQLCVI